MAVWYEVEKTEDGIKSFLFMNCEFHDYRMNCFNYDIANDKVDIFLKYDTDDEGVLLRFVGIDDFRVSTDRNWDLDWMPGSTMSVIDSDFIWLDNDDWGKESVKHIDDMKQYATWVKARRVFWALTDANGNPVEMPERRKHLILTEYDKTFNLVEFNGDWKEILSPKGEQLF